MPAASLRDRVDLDQTAVIADEESLADPEAGVLGKLVFYSIGDTIRVTFEELERLFDLYGVDRDFLPKQINPGTIASGLLRGMNEEIPLDGKSYELTFHVEGKVDGALEAPLVRSRRRTPLERGELASREATDWQAVAEWDVQTVATVVWDPAFPDELPGAVEPEHAAEYDYEGLIETIREDFDERRLFYGGAAVSAIVARILNDTMSIRTRPTGGVWLIPSSAIDVLDRLEQLVKLLDSEYRRPATEGKTPAGTEFDSIILVDRAKNRLYVRDKVESRVLADIDAAIERLSGMVGADVRPRPAELAEIAGLRKQALAYRDSFALVVEGGSERIARKLADFDRAYAAAIAGGRAG